MLTSAIALETKVRKSSNGDWFYEGTVIATDPILGTVDVDFNDWIERFEASNLTGRYTEDGTFEYVLDAVKDGIKIYDFTQVGDTVEEEPY